MSLDEGDTEDSCFENNCLRKLHPRGRVGRRVGCWGKGACNVVDVYVGERRIPRIAS